MSNPSVTDDREDEDGIISGTFPSYDDLVKIFGGCCCVKNCPEEEKQKGDDYTMSGDTCCPELDPETKGKTPPGEEAPPHDPDPPGNGGTCELIKLQIAMHANPYLGFAFGFEPILNIPPDIPTPPLPDASLFGIPPVNIPAMPMPDPLPTIGDLPELDLYYPPLPPEIPGPPGPPNIPTFPGFGLFTFSLFPVKLGLDLISLKPPEIPGVDCASLLQFTTLVPEQEAARAKCEPLPPAEFNMAVCWLCILCFMLLLVIPLLAILLGMKQKGVFKEITDEEGNIKFFEEGVDEDGNKTYTAIPFEIPPPVNIIHSRLPDIEGIADPEKHNQFYRLDEDEDGKFVKLLFQASIHHVKRVFNIDFPLFGDDIPVEPNVQLDRRAGHESGGYATFPGKYYIKWEIFGKPGGPRAQKPGSKGPSQELLNFMNRNSPGNTRDADGNPIPPQSENYVASDFEKFMKGDGEIAGFESLFNEFRDSVSPGKLGDMSSRRIKATSSAHHAQSPFDESEEIIYYRWPEAKPLLSYHFEYDGFYEIYSTIKKEGEEKEAVMMTTVLIGPKPQMPTELPPILNIMRSPLEIVNPVAKTETKSQPPEDPVKPEPTRKEPEDPPITPEKDDIRL